MKQVGSEVSGIVKDIVVDVGEFFSVVCIMVGVIGYMYVGGFFDCKGMIDILCVNLEQNFFVFGSWFVEVLNVFDGKQVEMKDKVDFGGNKIGQFLFYWLKDCNNVIQFSIFDIDYFKEWYVVVVQSMKGVIIKFYMVDGMDVFMIMSFIVYLVIFGGKLIGVLGVDILFVLFLICFVVLCFFEIGCVMFVLQDGKWFVGFDVGNMMKDYDGVVFEKIKVVIVDKMIFQFEGVIGKDGVQFECFVYFFDLFGLNVCWVVFVDVLVIVVVMQVCEQIILMVVGGFVVFFVVIIGFYFFVCCFV